MSLLAQRSKNGLDHSFWLLESAGITDQTLTELRSLRHLKRVSFATYRKGVTCAGFRDWKSAASIEHLTLSGFHVSEAGWGAISEFINLRRFTYRSISGGFANRRPATIDANFIDWKSLGLLSVLEHLYIDGLTNRAVEGIGQCRKLKSLQLGGEGFSDDGLKLVSDLTELEELHLEDTNVTGSGFIHPESFTRLKIVKLKGSRLDDAGLARISQLPALERLDIESTQVTPDGLSILAASKPTLKYLVPPLTIWEPWEPEHKTWVSAVEKLRAEIPGLEVNFRMDVPP